jgi:serine/threonine protein kinase
MDGLRPLGGRYKFVKSLRGTAKTITWRAHESSTGTDVVASIVAKQRGSGLAPILRARHEHLSTILDIIEVPDKREVPTEEALPEGSVVVVAEYIRGQNLGSRLDVGPLAVEDAVEWVARIADGLALIHRRGGVHGAVSPRAIIVARPDRSLIPQLTHLVVPPSGAYCAPERVTGGGPSIPDDIWALVATLYSALSRRAPFHGATRTDLARAIVAAQPEPLDGVDADLAEIVLRGLSREPKSRFESATALQGALRDWMERTGARSLGDFAPVSTTTAPMEPVPNVGDLSLVAALAAPDTVEARAPMPSIPPRADDDLDLPSDVGDLKDSAAPLGSEPVASLEPPSRAAPGVPTTPPAKKKPSSSKLLLLLVVLGLLSAGIGGMAGRLRALASGAAKQPESAERAPEGPGTQIANEPSTGAPANVASVAMPAQSAAADDIVVEPAAPAKSAATEAPPVASAAPPPAAATAAAPTGAPPGDLNACVARLMPEGAIGAGRDFGFLCKEKEFWSTARRFDLEVAKHGRGPGMVMWTQIGRFDLAAISYIWHHCCPSDSKPFVAATPKGVCEGLTEAVHDVGKDLSPDKTEAYSAAVECLFTRQVHHPSEWWDRVGPKDARAAFEQFREMIAKLR